MPKKKFEILDHTADVRLRAYGKDRQELFENLLLGMMTVLQPKIVGQAAKRKIEVKAVDENALLVDFLSEALYFSQAEGETYEKVVFDELSDTKLSAGLFGNKTNGFEKEIKAVSYQEVEIKKTNDLWEATVIFDI